MKLIKSGSKDWQEGADYFKKILLEANDIQAGNFMIQEVRIRPGIKATNHYHRQQIELFYAINDYGYFIVGEKNIKLEAGNMLLVNTGEKHTVANDSQEEFRFLAIKLTYNKEDTFTD